MKNIKIAEAVSTQLILEMSFLMQNVCLSNKISHVLTYINRQLASTAQEKTIKLYLNFNKRYKSKILAKRNSYLLSSNNHKRKYFQISKSQGEDRDNKGNQNREHQI